MAALYNLPQGIFSPGTSAVSAPRITRRRAFHRGTIVGYPWGAVTQVLVLLWSVVALGFLLLTVAGFLAG